MINNSLLLKGDELRFVIEIEIFLDSTKLKIENTHLKDTFDVLYFKLPHISNLSQHIKNKLLNFAKSFAKKM